jgi:hypothetical protein
VTPEADALEQFYLRAIHSGEAPPPNNAVTEPNDTLVEVLIDEERQ